MKNYKITVKGQGIIPNQVQGNNPMEAFSKVYPTMSLTVTKDVNKANVCIELVGGKRKIVNYYMVKEKEEQNYIKHYKGKLGEFDYNIKEFDLISDYDMDWLSYKNKKIRDGRQVKIPQGINSCRYMFDNCKDLIVAPEIPKGVKNCSYMFYGCISLKVVPTIPQGVSMCEGMFQNCKSLEVGPIIPIGVITCKNMFSDCDLLKVVQSIPDGVVNCEGMFRRCKVLEEVPILPYSVENVDGMFTNTRLDLNIIRWHLAHRGKSYKEYKVVK